MAKGSTATPATPEEVAADRPVKDIIREKFDSGMSRAAIAAELGVTYQRVFQVTKGLTNAATAEGGRGRKIILESGEPRVDYIRRRFAEGITRGAIAKELGISYQIVFQATKVKDDDEGEDEAGDGSDLETENEADGESDADEAEPGSE